MHGLCTLLGQSGGAKEETALGLAWEKAVVLGLLIQLEMGLAFLIETGLPCRPVWASIWPPKMTTVGSFFFGRIGPWAWAQQKT